MTDSRILRGPARVRATKARLAALQLMPYFATPLMRSTLIESPGLGTVAIDERLRIYVDPVAVENWSNDELAGAILHEVNHVIRLHFSRAPKGPQNAHRWNIAGDLEINDDLAMANVKLPTGALHPATFGFEPHLSAEQYYDLLPEDSEESCDCGSGADAIRRDYELPGDSPIGLPAEDLPSIVRAVANEIRSAPPGTIPGGLSRWAESLVPVIPWETVLRACVRRGLLSGSGGADFSWSSPSRRARPPIILPRLRNRRLSAFCVVDTSGSMDDALINRALAEVCGVAKSLSVDNVYLASCDTHATYHGRFNARHRFELFGGGGTSLERALPLIDENRLKIELVVFVTDGYTNWSPEPPAQLRRAATVVVTPEGAPPGPAWAKQVVIPV